MRSYVRTLLSRFIPRILFHGCLGVLVAMVFLSIPAWAQESKTVRISTGEWPPYTSKNLKGYGAVSQIITEAYAIEGYKVEYGFYPWKRSLEMARVGQWDASSAWQVSAEREKHFLFSDPVMDTEIVFFHNKGAAFDWEDYADLKGLTIGTTRGYLYSARFRESARQGGAKLIDSDSDLVNLKLLLKGRIDLHPLNKHVGQHILNEHFSPEQRAQIGFHSRLISRGSISVVFPKSVPRSQEFLAALNRGLNKLRESGRHREIMSSTLGDETPLRVAVSHWPPWIVMENEGLSGIDIEMLEAIGKRTGLTFEYVECPWKRCIEMMKTGELDIITNFSKDSEREEYVRYVEPSYCIQSVVFYSKLDSLVKIEKYEDLSGLTIGMLRGANYFDAFDEDNTLRKVPVASDIQLPEMLFQNRVDIVAGWEKTMDYFIKQAGYEKDLVKSPYRVSGLPIYYAISKASRGKEHAEDISMALEKMKESGDLDGIIRAFIDNASPE